MDRVQASGACPSPWAQWLLASLKGLRSETPTPLTHPPTPWLMCSQNPVLLNAIAPRLEQLRTSQFFGCRSPVDSTGVNPSCAPEPLMAPVLLALAWPPQESSSTPSFLQQRPHDIRENLQAWLHPSCSSQPSPGFQGHREPLGKPHRLPQGRRSMDSMAPAGGRSHGRSSLFNWVTMNNSSYLAACRDAAIPEGQHIEFRAAHSQSSS